jgi:hypothetical protein
MTNPSKPVYALIDSVYAEPSFQSAIAHILDWAPELKHENHITTLISTYLRKSGVNSRREVSGKKQRVDVEIQGESLEAKYHFEGDLLGIPASFGTIASSDKLQSWRSVATEIHGDLVKPDRSYFLWFVCIRSNETDEIYRCSDLIGEFYKRRGVSTLNEAVQSAEELIKSEINAKFQPLLSGPPVELPNLVGTHSVLISRLYPLKGNTCQAV